MRITNQKMDKDFQTTRLIRAVATLFELITIFGVVWGIVNALEYIGKLF